MMEDTAPKFLKRNCELYPKEVAMRQKKLGIWQEYSWQECCRRVKLFSLGLSALGFKEGDRVAIVAESAPEWLWSELSIQAQGGIPVGIPPSFSPLALKYVLDDCRARFVIVDDQEQVDKLLSIQGELSEVRKVIYWDSKGMYAQRYNDPFLLKWEELLKLGEEHETPVLFEQGIEKGKGEDTSILLYREKGPDEYQVASISQKEGVKRGKLWAEVEGWERNINQFSPSSPVRFTEQLYSLFSPLVSAAVVNFPKAESMAEDMREIAPQVIHFSFRYWEKVLKDTQERILGVRRSVANLFLPVGLRGAKDKPGGFGYKLQRAIGHWTFFRPLQDKLGLLKVKDAYTYGRIEPFTVSFFQAIGVNLKRMYEVPEIGVVAMHRSPEVNPETFGPPFPGVEIRISDEDKVLVRKRGEKVWIETGEDKGYIDDRGELVLT
jgi:long-chain acyl-CoA synthetase